MLDKTDQYWVAYILGNFPKSFAPTAQITDIDA